MKIKYLYLILFLVISKNIFAQENYVKGYVILNNNDSISGLINFRMDEHNGQFCQFKLSKTDAEQTFYPNDILKYRFIDEGKYYVSHKVMIDSIPRQVFLEYLVNGVMNLYFYKDNKTFQDYYFFEDEFGQMTSVNEKKQYIGTLNYLFRDYPTINKKFSKNSSPMPFKRKNMIGIAEEYHTQMCSPGQECIIFSNDYKKQYLDFKLAVYAGYQTTVYSIDRFSITGMDFEAIIYSPGLMRSSNPVIGGQLLICNPRLTNSFCLLADIGLSKISGEAQDSHIKQFELNYCELSFNSLLLMGKINLKYISPKGKIRPTAEAGFSYFGLINKTSLMYFEEQDPKQNFNISEIKDFKSFPQSTLLGINCGIGLSYLLKNNKSIFCNFSYNNATGGRTDGWIKANTPHNLKVAQLNIGYNFY